MKIIAEGKGWMRYKNEEGEICGAVWPIHDTANWESMTEKERDLIWEETTEAIMQAFSGAWEALAKL